MSRRHLNTGDQVLNGLNGNGWASNKPRGPASFFVRRALRTMLKIYLFAIVGYAMVQPLVSDWFFNYLRVSGIMK